MPFRAERALARSLFAPGEFVEVYVDTPLAVCAERDPKGLYAKALAGDLKNFTGIDSPYEPPLEAEVVLAAGEAPAEACADMLVGHLTSLP